MDYTELREEQAKARAEGKLMGIGISTYGEICAMGPRPPLPAGGWESATVKIEPTGKVTVMTGASPHGQGEETTFAQIAADELGVRHRRRAGDPRRHGDRAVRHRHVRQPRHGGRRRGAVLRAAGSQSQDEEVRRHAARNPRTSTLPAARCADEATGKSVSFGEMAVAAYHAKKLPANTEPGLVATHFWEPPNFTFPFGAHIVVTEVDRDTGDIDIKRYVAVDDCGKIINPLIVDGQVHGGVAQGLGQALWEEAVYDDNGQLVTGELTDYAIPRAHVHAVDRKQPHGDAVAGESAGREGRGRGRHHRLLAGGGELGGGCALAAGRAAYRHAADAAEDLEADPAGRPGMIPQEFEYTAPATLQEALALIEGGDRKILAGGMSLIPLMKLRLAAPGEVVDLGRVPGLERDRGERRRRAHRRHGHASRGRELAGDPRASARCWPRRRATSATFRCATWARSAAASRMPIPAADYPAALVALEAQIRLVSAKSDRTVEASEFFLDAFTTALEPGEIVLEVLVAGGGRERGPSVTRRWRIRRRASRWSGSRRGSRSRGGKITMARIGVTGHGAARRSARAGGAVARERRGHRGRRRRPSATARRPTRTSTPTAIIAGIWRGFTRRAR